MKKLTSIILLVLFTSVCVAQNGINYKALIKDDNGNVIVYGDVDIEFSILENTTIVYTESQALLTDQNGIIITNIGNGIPILGTFNEIDWSKDNHFLNIKVDIGNGFTDLGTTQFMAVPYALNAKTANNVALEAINEGSGIGYRIIDRTAADYGNIGLDAIDFSVSVLNSQDYGATGFRSMATGSQTLASGLESLAIGIQTTASGDRSMASGNGTTASQSSSFAAGKSTTASGINAFAIGQNTSAEGESAITAGIFSIASGKASVAIGDNVTAASYAETAIGLNSVNYSPTSATTWNANDRLFTIGNGSNSSNKSNALTVLKNGNIGISTHLPQAKLHITNGVDASATNGSGYAVFGNTNGQNITIDENEIMARDNNAISNLNLQVEGGNVVTGGEIRVNNVVSSGTAMRVNGDEALWYNGTHFSWGFGGQANYFADNIGIGTTSPDSRLQIVGGSDVQVDNGAGYLILGNTDGQNVAFDNNDIMARDNNGFSTLNLNINGGTVATGSNFRIGGTELLAVSDIYLRTSTSFTPLGGTSPSLGSLQHQWWEVFSLNGFASTSDRRHKTNIQNLNYGLDEVMQLKPVSYTWKKHPNSTPKIGFIAQDLQEVLPEVVVTKDTSLTPIDSNSENSSDTMAVFYSEIIPVLTKAIQEQQKTIESQNAKIKQIEAKLDILLAENKK